MRRDLQSLAMIVFDVALGLGMLVVAAMLARHAGILDDRLREHQIRKVAFTRFGTQPMDAYRPAGRPILSQLRWALAAVHVFGIIGVGLLMYSCPKL
jgi:hypothetical protein